MKKLEIETSNGKFLLIDQDENGRVVIPELEHVEIGRLKYLTEQQASEIVDSSIHTGLYGHYVADIPLNAYCYTSAIKSLHSLIKSKGVHLFENPNSKPAESMFYKRKSDGVSWGDYLMEEFNKSEQNTFYNPYIFKII